MKRAVLCLSALLAVIAHAIAQPKDEFPRLEGLAGKAFVDSACGLPYALVVSHLGESSRLMGTALRYSEELGYRKGEADSHAWLGIITYLQGRYELSVGHGQRAIGLYRELGDRRREGGQYALLGFQMKGRDLPRAEALMLTGIRMQEAEADSGSLTGSYDNYGMVKLAMGQRDSAMHFFHRALRLKRSLSDSLGLPYSLNKLATVLLEDGRMAEARAALDEAYRIRALRNDRYGLMENYAFYGDWHMAASRPDSAEHWYHKAVEAAKEQGYPFLLRNVYLRMSELYESKGDMARALRLYRAHSAVKDSLINEQRIRQVTELEMRFETAEKERENLLLRQERAEQQLVVSRQRLWMLGLAGLTVALLLGGALLFQRQRQREAARRDAAIIAERELGLRSIITATEQERGRIAKDLHDGIVQTLTGIRLRLANEGREGHSASLPELDSAIAEVRDISHRMMPRALEQAGLLPAISDMLDKSLGAAGIPYSLEEMGVGSDRLPPHLETGVFRICQELVNNIIKHAKASQVSVQVLRNGPYLILMAEDDGIGMPPDAEASDGLGLSGMRSRAAGMGGEISFDRSPAGGTVAMLRVRV